MTSYYHQRRQSYNEMYITFSTNVDTQCMIRIHGMMYKLPSMQAEGSLYSEVSQGCQIGQLRRKR